MTTSGSGLQNLISGPLFEPYFRNPRFIDRAVRAGFPCRSVRSILESGANGDGFSRTLVELLTCRATVASTPRPS